MRPQIVSSQRVADSITQDDNILKGPVTDSRQGHRDSYSMNLQDVKVLQSGVDSKIQNQYAVKLLTGPVVSDLEVRLQDVNYPAIIDDSDLVMFGEIHPVEKFRDDLATYFPKFQEMGFDVLGMEMFPSDMQDLLDRYYETGEGLDEIRWHLESYWDWGDEEGVESYINFVVMARESGLRIVGLERPFGLCDNDLTQCVDQLDVRDDWTSSIIMEQIGAGKKMIALVGAYHLRGDRIPARLPDYVNYLRIGLYGGSPLDDKESYHDFDFYHPLLQDIKEQNLDQDPFMVELMPGERGHFETDIIAYYPELEPPSASQITHDIAVTEFNEMMQELAAALVELVKALEDIKL